MRALKAFERAPEMLAAEFGILFYETLDVRSDRARVPATANADLQHTQVSEPVVLVDVPHLPVQVKRLDIVVAPVEQAPGPAAEGPRGAARATPSKHRGRTGTRATEHSRGRVGHARAQRRTQATVPSETRHIAVEVASDKEETNRILSDLGIPVPRQYMIDDAERAVRAAERIGYPVVVKPLDANHGRGVSIRMMDAEQVRAAVAVAQKHSRMVVVESYLEGLDHRMLVVNGELIAVAKRVPGHVVGDGKQTIAPLVDEVNSEPRRGVGPENAPTPPALDPHAQRRSVESAHPPTPRRPAQRVSRGGAARRVGADAPGAPYGGARAGRGSAAGTRPRRTIERLWAAG